VHEEECDDVVVVLFSHRPAERLVHLFPSPGGAADPPFPNRPAERPIHLFQARAERLVHLCDQVKLAA
jgi:hypothetical protein